ncbi:uncharacterized protein N7483_005131 [Penicillium malachiteum]|uniref:uncharacterized protein n=1 Tax=Penicillium malachiteum TaxID=1324776 RepID=UPI002549BC0D|nr:uncharacterized protein N7483_005131 [Penicillium malachiteum]KAJ5730623.1 hypothetical protein N7483_005131 [Penicillium malachiteum]
MTGKKIRASLKKDKLTDLLDINIIRPKRTDNNGRTWYRLSLAVAEWLILNISEDISKLIHQTDSRMIFADEIFQAIRKHMEGMNIYANMKKLERWNDIKVTDYASTLEFVEDVLIASEGLANRGIVIPPYVVLMKVLDGLTVRNLDLSKRVFMDSPLENLDPSKLTLEIFNFIIRGIQHELFFEERMSVDGDTKVGYRL